MGSLNWSSSHEVFVPELDDEHQEVFQALSNLQGAVNNRAPLQELASLSLSVSTCLLDHFAHEERLMRASRYTSLRWHKRSHDGVRKRVRQCLLRVEKGDTDAGRELVDYLSSWLRDHTGVADRMMGAFLRNQNRVMWKLTLQAGTRPVDACTWVDSSGAAFEPKTSRKKS
jgi:hemerythrin-like metal-binding protein